MRLISSLFPINLPEGLRFEKAENSDASAIYFRSGLYESYIEEYAGLIDVLPDGYIHVYVLAEHYLDNNEIRPDLRVKLEKILSYAPLVREYIINSDGILPIRHFHKP